MKKITLPNVKQFPMAKCCGTKASRDFIFPNDVPDACCGAFSLNFGSGETDQNFFDSGGNTLTNSCEATVRFTSFIGSSNPGDVVQFTVVDPDLGGISYYIPINSGFIDIVIPAGVVVILTISVIPTGEPIPVQLTMTNLTCGTPEELIFNWELAVPECCGLQTYPMAAPVVWNGDYWDTFSTPYIVQGICDSDLEFSADFSNQAGDSFAGFDVYVNGNPIGLTPGTPVTVTVSPGDTIFFIAYLGITGIGGGVFTFSVRNLTCETGPDVVWVCELTA